MDIGMEMDVQYTKWMEIEIPSISAWIPWRFSWCFRQEVLDLAKNQLTGELPWTATQWRGRKLKRLDVARSSLEQIVDEFYVIYLDS